jgi:hypothetical protein
MLSAEILYYGVILKESWEQYLKIGNKVSIYQATRHFNENVRVLQSAYLLKRTFQFLKTN